MVCWGNFAGEADEDIGFDFAVHNCAGAAIGKAGIWGTGGKGGGGDGASGCGTCCPSGILGISPALKDILKGRSLLVDCAVAEGTFVLSSSTGSLIASSDFPSESDDLDVTVD